MKVVCIPRPLSDWFSTLEFKPLLFHLSGIQLQYYQEQKLISAKLHLRSEIMYDLCILTHTVIQPFAARVWN